MNVTNVLSSGYFFGEIARTIAEIPAIKAVNGNRKRSTKGRIAAARQKWLGIASQVRTLNTPQSANNEEPSRIRDKAAATRIIASRTLRLGVKLCGIENC
jgi:hypothetical protein